MHLIVCISGLVYIFCTILDMLIYLCLFATQCADPLCVFVFAYVRHGSLLFLFFGFTASSSVTFNHVAL